MSAQDHPCQTCNLCCDGTLFHFVPLSADEQISFADRITLAEQGDQRGLAQPCAFSRPGSCGCYASRPQACRTYRCASLIALEAGTIDEAELRRRTGAALCARSRLLHMAKGGETLKQLRDDLSADKGPVRKPALHLALGVLEMLLDRHFRRDDRRVMQVNANSGRL